MISQSICEDQDVFAFEFMDLPWLPDSLRQTLREILDCALSAPFRSYYDLVVEQVLKRVSGDGQIAAVAELGAGTAPITAEGIKQSV